MNCINLIHLGIVIAIIVFDILIYIWTNKNPLEIFNKNNNMINKSTINITNELIRGINQCQCGLIITNNSCTEEQIISNSTDMSLNSIKNLFRNLDIDCNDLNEQIKKNGD